MAVNHIKLQTCRYCAGTRKSIACNDVIERFCIISGAIGSGIILRIAKEFSIMDFTKQNCLFLIDFSADHRSKGAKTIATTQSDKLYLNEQSFAIWLETHIHL